jgi:ELWxxDGT repeat protein
MKTIGLLASLLFCNLVQTQTLVKDINTGVGNSSPVMLASLSRGLVFAASTPTYGAEIWVSDGTATGTMMLKDIRPGFSSSFNQINTFVSGDMLYMVLMDSTTTNANNLWRTDGTSQGTIKMMTFSQSWQVPNATLNQMSGVNGKCIFVYGDNNNKELWVCDGTAAGTRLLKDIKPGTNVGSNPYNLVAMGDFVYFFADDGVHGYELWRTDGTETGTTLVKDIFPGPVSSLQNIAQNTNMLAGTNKVYFSAISDITKGFELFVSDGSDGGTFMVKDLNPESYANSALFIAGAADSFALVFYRKDNFNYLCRTDGTEAGTYDLLDSSALITTIPNFRTYVNAGEQMFFAHSTQSTGQELWSSDGTAEGTGLLLDLSPGNVSGFGNAICAHEGKAYFAGLNNLVGRELFVSSGYKGTTHLYLDLFPGLLFNNFQYIMMHQGMLYASANRNDGKGTELYKIDPNSFLTVSDIQHTNSTIWPNPVRAGETLKLGLSDAMPYELKDLSGRTIQSGISKDTEIMLNTDISAGIYFLSLQTPQGNITKKLQVNK